MPPSPRSAKTAPPLSDNGHARLLPSNQEAEERTLGALMLDPAVIGPVMEVVRPEHFYKGKHRLICEAIFALHSQGDRADLLTVVDWLKRAGKLDHAGGPETVARLADDVSTARSAARHAKLVRDAATLRSIIQYSEALSDRAYRGEIPDVGEFVADMELAAEEIAGSYSSLRKPTICLADVEAEETRWLWYPYIPLGKLTVFEGDPGVGKSFATLAIATSVSLGVPFPRGPNDGTREGPGTCLLFTGEDGPADTIKPRLMKMGADCSRVHVWVEGISFDATGLKIIERQIEILQPRFVVIDPITSFLGGKMDLNKSTEIRGVLDGLGRIAGQHGCAIVCLRHLRKGGADRDIYRGQGAIDITAAARSVLMAGKDPNDESNRAIVHIKSNLAQTGPPLGYKMVDGTFAWTEGSDLTAGRILAPSESPEESTALTQAKEFLLEILGEAGSARAQDVQAEARKAGISEATLRRARAALRVKTDKSGSFGKGGCWYWSLPTVPKSMSTLDHLKGDEHLRDEHLRGDEHLNEQHNNNIIKSIYSPPPLPLRCSRCSSKPIVGRSGEIESPAHHPDEHLSKGLKFPGVFGDSAAPPDAQETALAEERF